MVVPIACSLCGVSLRVEEELIGKQVLCPKCRQTFVARVQPPPPPLPRALPVAPPRASNVQTRKPASIPVAVWAAAIAFAGVMLIGGGFVLAWTLLSSSPPALTEATPEKTPVLNPASDANSVPENNNDLNPAGLATPGETQPPRKKREPLDKQPNAKPDSSPAKDKPQPNPPVAKEQPISPPRAEEFLLNAAIADVAVGARGRFLILHLPAQNQLALFDVKEKKVVHHFPAADLNVKFAAGQSKLLVMLGDKQMIERYDLHSRKLEASAPLPWLGEVRNLALGCAAENPALVLCMDGIKPHGFAPVRFLDVNTLKPLDIEFQNEKGRPAHFNSRDVMHFRAAANGLVFGAWCTSHTPQGVDAVVLHGARAVLYHEHTSASPVLPGPDGKTLFTEQGTITPGLKSNSKMGPKGMRIPSVQGNYHLRVVPATKNPKQAEIYLGNMPQPLFTLSQDAFELANEAWTKDDFTNDKRIHYLHQDKLLITIPPSRDRLVLHELDLKELLEKSSENPLIITSLPPLLAHPGQSYEYQVQVESKQDEVSFTLQFGPPGAAISPDGRFTWAVPADAPKSAKVTILVRDGAGKQVGHGFTITIDEEKAFHAVGNQPGSKHLFRYPGIGGAVLAGDGKTLIVSVPSKGILAYIDTVEGKELKQVEVDFQPAQLAHQDGRLFVAVSGAPRIFALDIGTGKELSEIRLPGAALVNLACHPMKGMLYAVNQNHEVFAIDPQTGQSKLTQAKGQYLAIDSETGGFLYTGIQKPIQEKLIIQEGPRQSLVISLALANTRAIMLKYRVAGDDLILAGANDNAATNGRGLGLSGDGQRIAMAGGGGWRPQGDPKANYAIAIFDTADMNTLLGQIPTGAYPANIAFHPLLKYGAAYRSGGSAELFIFKDKSYLIKKTIKLQRDFSNNLLLFGGQGTNVIYVPTLNNFSKTEEMQIQIFPLPLTEDEQAELKKTYPK